MRFLITTNHTKTRKILPVYPVAPFIEQRMTSLTDFNQQVGTPTTSNVSHILSRRWRKQISVVFHRGWNRWWFRLAALQRVTSQQWGGGSQLCDNNEGVSCCVPYRVTVTSHSPCKAPGRRPGVATDKVSAPRRHARPHFAHSFYHRNLIRRC